MHTRQHKARQENTVSYLSCLMLLKGMKTDMALCMHVLSDVLKPTMSIDAPGTIRRTVEWSILLEKSLSTN